MPISAGTRFGFYDVTGPLGSGGMGEVYRARDTKLKREVALKVLPSELSNDADRLARFEREAEVLASLNHPNIAQIYGVEVSDGTTALVMELVEGATLAESIDQGRLPVDEALRVATQIADALEAAHTRGIVHRDLKPANIKLRPDGTVKVLDFGIAKALDTRTTGPGPAALTTPAMTQAGFVLGTAAYMSPEQAKGKAVDQRTDVWAFGCVLYEMLTGRAAFLGEDVTSTLARVLEGRADLNALPTAASPAVRRTLELCLEKDARKRIADMRDVKLALAGAFTSEAPAQPLWRRALPAVTALVVGVLLASAYFAGIQSPAARVEVAPPVAVSRLLITPPATAPLANMADLDLAISPDGRRIAYWARLPDSGNLELYVRELDALEARAIPGTETPVTSTNRNPFFSPDGRSVGYGAPDRSLTAVAIDGRPPVRMVNNVDRNFLGASWGADNTVIFSTLLRLERVSAAGGGTPEPLMPDVQEGAVAGPVLLPGGRAVLFHAFADGPGDRVAVLDLETQEVSTVIEGGSNPSYLDSGHLVFVRGDTLMAVPFEASELAVTGEAVAMVQGVRRPAGGAADYALSANGTLAYVPGNPDEASNASIVWIDRAGALLGQVVPDVIASPRDVRLSPDGQRLLLVTGPDGDADLWSYDLRGRPPIPLALPGDNRLPVWSPKGDRVAFLALNAGGLVTLASDGSERIPQPLHSPPVIFAPYAWATSGELILARLTGQIAATSAAPTSEVREILASDTISFDPALSPDSRWLAYVSVRTGRPEIWVQGYPEGVPTRLSSNGGYEPLWSADGRELFYREGNAVMIVEVSTQGEFSFTAPRPLFSGPYLASPLPTFRGYDVASDGRFLMILPTDEGVAPPPSIVVVQNFGEELKQRVRPSGQ
jgi:serine/threonine-protein kinase